MTRRRLRLLCDSNPMCYGSSASMLSILDHVDADITALVQGVTAEILSADPAVDDTIVTDLKDPGAVARDADLSSFDAVLVVSNQSNVELYHQVGLPVFFVDILYFYGRHKTGPVWSLARQTFVQTFPGVRERLADARTAGSPEVIGPLVRTREVLPDLETPRRGTLVHIGGAQSRWIQPGVNSPYPRLVVRWLEALRDHLPAPIVLAAGARAAEVARSVASDGIEVRTFPQHEFLSRLRTCELYLTTPGLGAVFEGGLHARDMLMLPPQNATQVVQLAAYEAAGLVAPGINLPALDEDFASGDPAALTEEALTFEVLRALGRMDERPRTREVASHILKEWSNPQRRAATERFMATLGPPGGRSVADAIMNFWRQACP